jgi:AcrR family transcriptional regulator
MSMRLTAPERRVQLMQVGLEAFARNGYHGTSMNHVADAAGVTKPVLYQHFESKRELYLALLDEVGSQMIKAITDATAAAPDGKSKTERGFAAYFRWVHDDQAAFLLLFGSGARRDEEFNVAVQKITAAAAESIAPLIAIDIDPEHQRLTAHALVGIAEGVSRMLIGDGDSFDPDLVARQVADLAWAGLRAVRRID